MSEHFEEDSFKEEVESVPLEQEQSVPESEEPQVDSDSVNKPCITKLTDKENKANTYVVGIPSSTLVEFTKALNRFSETLTDANPNHVNWKKVSEEALDFYTPGGLYQDRLDDPKGNWQQGTIGPNNALAGIASVPMRTGDGELKGEIALLFDLAGHAEFLNENMFDLERKEAFEKEYFASLKRSLKRSAEFLVKHLEF